MTPTGQIGWKPRYSPDGLRVTWERDPGYWQAQWFTETQEIAQNGAVLVLGAFPGIITDWLGANELSAGGGVWVGFRTDPIRIYTNTGLEVLGAGAPVVNPWGFFGYVDDYNADVKNLIWMDTAISRGAITSPRASKHAIVWTQDGRTWGAKGGAAQDIQAAPAEFGPVPIDLPDGSVWVGCYTHTGLVTYPFGETEGYAFDTNKQSFYPDWKYEGPAADDPRAGLVAIFTNDRGEQFTHFFDMAAPRVPLGAGEPEPPDPGPEPPEPPDPGPKPPEPPVDPHPPIIIGGPMTQETGWLIGPGDKVLSCDAAGAVTFSTVTLSDADLLQLDPIDGDRRGTYRPVAHLDRYITADSTQFAPGGNACLAYYGAPASEALGPDGKPGWYQRWDVGVWASGIVTALVPYIEQGAGNGRHWASPGLTWVKKA